jgi:hypothetical protein
MTRGVSKSKELGTGRRFFRKFVSNINQKKNFRRLRDTLEYDIKSFGKFFLKQMTAK